MWTLQRNKNQRKYDEHIIDCCKADPEDRIYFRLCDGKTEIIAKIWMIMTQR